MNHYTKEIDLPYSPLLVIKEASRCLLCIDAPCSQECPADTKPDQFIRSVYFRNFKGAAEIIRENNALGSTCARVCPTEKLCQKGCLRSGIDEPIDIGKIQRYITDFEAASNMTILTKSTQHLGKVAIIGSGPAGLQAAASLAHLGYQSDVYEKENELGGWLRYGIPEYRLPNHIVDEEIDRIKALGVNFKTNQNIGQDISIDTLKAEYDAVLIAVGTSYGRVLPMFENNPYVITAAEFLPDAKMKQGEIPVPKSVLVIGGGDVAMDVATTYKMVGCETVTCVARETLSNFPASLHELHNAQDQNVSILDGFSPIAVEGNAVTFEHVLMNSKLTIQADKIILAIGQYSKLDQITNVEHQHGIIQTRDYQTTDPKIFAAGDIVEGDKTVVYAVKTGKEVAESIHNILTGGK